MSEKFSNTHENGNDVNHVLANGFSCEKILNEKDPLLREIWAAGYTHVETDYAMNRIRLINETTRYIKDIPISKYNQCIVKLRFCIGFNLAGCKHIWIKEADGSAKLFRDLIQAVCQLRNKSWLLFAACFYGEL